MGSWIEACKEYALKSGKYTVPKKDSPEYAEIKKIAERLEAAKPPAAPGTTAAPVIVEAPKAVRKALPKKVKAAVAVPAVPVPVVVAPTVVTDTSVADVSKPRVRKPRVPKPAVVVDEVVAAVTPVVKKVRKTAAVSGVTAVEGPVTLKF